MKRTVNLSAMSNDDLVNLFEELCRVSEIASDERNFRKFNRYYDAIAAVASELKGRPGDQRVALKVLLGEGNLQVRLTAARALLAVDRAAAMRELKEIAAMHGMPHAGDAGMTLHNLETGFFKPQ